jgi:hypothetical protein
MQTDVRPITLPDQPPVPPAPQTARRSAEGRLALTAGALLSLVLLVAGYALGVPGLRLVGVFGALIAGVGAAPLQLSVRPTLVERLGVAVTVGLSVAFLVGIFMVVVPFWHPFVAAALIGVPAAVVHGIGVVRALPMLDRGGRGGRPVRDPSGRRAARYRPLSLACTVAGTVLWLVPALSTHDADPGTWGFLSHISPAWYVGLVLLIAAIVLAARLGEGYVASAVISLGAALTATPALVYGLPRSQSAIKHIVLVQHILTAHHLSPGASIYYAYSGFFAGIAWLCRLAGVTDPTDLATAWPWLIGLLAIIELRFLFGRLIGSPYRCWIGVTLAVLANAIGQDYFSPQSAAYVLVLGVCAIALVSETGEVLTPRMKLAVLVLAGCALAVTHELSPYVAGGVLIILGVFRMVRPRWAAATALVPAAVWAVANVGVLSGFINFAEIGNLSNFAPPHTAASTGLNRASVVGDSSHALLLALMILIVLALVGLARNRRRGGAWALLLCAGVGVVLLAVNAYGDEGIFRAALFGIPWLVILALAAVRQPRWRVLAVGPLCAVMLACFLVAQFGLDQTNVVHRDDVRALDAFIASAAPGSYRLEVGGVGDLPATLDPTIHNLTWDALWNPSSATQTALHATHPPTAADLEQLTQAYIAYAATIGHTPPRNLYVIWSKTAADYSADYGVETPANSQQWLNLFLASPHWELVYASGRSYLFRYVPHPGTAA